MTTINHTNQAQVGGYRQLSVLVIDDDDFTRNFYVSLLKKLGIGTVRDTASAATALDILAISPFNLIFCDYEMPLINGLSFVKLLRHGHTLQDTKGTNRLNCQTPVVMLTKHATSSVVKSTQEAGANGFLVKPVSLKALQQRIETFARRA